MDTQLVIFDWDGTLIDSTGHIARSLHHAAQQTGLPLLSQARYRSIIGLGLPEALRDLYPDIDEGTQLELRVHYASHYIASTDVEPCPIYPGAVALLEGLRARGIRLAVATGKNRPGLERAFASSGLGDYFVTSRTADETASKPDPQMLHEILAEQGVAAEAALMVGDTGFDLEMARRAQVPSIGITHGAHAADELLRHAPVALVDHLDHVFSVVAAPRSVRASFSRQRIGNPS